jgi:hypothetical protein
MFILLTKEQSKSCFRCRRAVVSTMFYSSLVRYSNEQKAYIRSGAAGEPTIPVRSFEFLVYSVRCYPMMDDDYWADFP